MIKKLRIKFVCVIMTIVMVLLGSILGVVLRFAGQNLEMQSISMLRTIAAGPFPQGAPGKPRDEEVRPPFFTVQISNRGELMAAGDGDFDLSDREYLQQIVHGALLSDRETGILEQYGLRYLKSGSPRGLLIVFADTTGENATRRQLYFGCLVIFFVAMTLFFGISILLSHWAIKPVATAWDQQRQFVADASHELKTPLSVIMANAELMHSEDTGEEERRRYAGNILAVSYQMRSLVENMLEMARVDNGSLKTTFGELDFSQFVSDAVLSFQLLYEEKGMGLQCRVPEGIRLHGSEQQLYQVMDVLLDNALKYSAPEGPVRVDLVSTGRSCLLSVASPGDPLSKEELVNIFKRFYRADKARTRNGSYGLGLSIAEAIVHAHKGKIWAESKNGHNTFYVQLPTK